MGSEPHNLKRLLYKIRFFALRFFLVASFPKISYTKKDDTDFTSAPKPERLRASAVDFGFSASTLVKKNVANGIKSFFIDGPAGRLEALLNEGQPDATHAALVCHPHPLFGGTMHNKVVYHAMKTLSGFGFPVLRFNFRGAGMSEGEHDRGHGEQDDVRAALNWIESAFTLPIIFCGFSFGAATGLRTACADPRVAGMIALGTPVGVEGRAYTYSFLKDCARPKLFVNGSRDQYGPPEGLKKIVDAASEPKEMVIVEGGDHFFEGHLAEMQAAIHGWVTRSFKPGRRAEAS